MSYTSLPQKYAAFAAIAVVAIAGSLYLSLRSEPGEVPQPPESKQNIAVQGMQEGAPDALPNALPAAEGQAAVEAQTSAEVVPDLEASAVNETLQMRRVSRFAKNSQIPASKRAQMAADRWELTDEQRRALEQILASYSKELASLEQAGMSDAELAAAQNDLQARQMQEVVPIIAASPKVSDSKQKFIDAARARGGRLVTD